MKIIDTRDGTTLAGECVAVIPANQPVPEELMLRYYKLRPGVGQYDVMARPLEYERVVLQRGDSVDRASDLLGEPSYYIVPKHPFYRVED